MLPSPACVALLLAANPVLAEVPRRFDFGPGPAAAGFAPVPATLAYGRNQPYGFEPGGQVEAVVRAAPDPLRRDFVTGARPFHFTTRVPREGNYRVSVTVGDAAAPTTTTIKAELRRLMVEQLETKAGEFRTVSFVVNVRTPAIAGKKGIPPGAVRLKAPRETVQEAWAWDGALTLEFSATRPAVCAVEVEPVEVPTLFLLGDSTVCDQSKEPYASWGQMFPRFFKPAVAIANHGESGETYRDSLARRRLDKILSQLQPGDWVFLQFGHNDQKQIAAGTGGPFTTYREELQRHVAAVRQTGGVAVVISPMERRSFDEAGRVKPSLAEYAAAARQVAEELHAPFIDLNAMSKPLYEALGPVGSAAAFAAPGGKVDNTHHNNYGSYQLAKCIVQAIRDLDLPLAQFVLDDVPRYDPARPDDPRTFAVPASGEFTNERPLGD